MPLSYTGIASGSNAASAQLHQVLDLLLGTMTDQPVYVANTIRASTTGATTAVFFAGGTAAGHPTTGAHGAGEIVADMTGIWWLCTGAGTPGTWIQMSASVDATAGDYASLVAAGSAAVAGSTTKAADAGHAHPALVNPSGGFTGNLLQLQLASVDKFKVDQTGLLTTVAGAVFGGGLSGISTISMSGALSGGTSVSATNLTGTLQTAAQPNITSVGTLSALVMSGAISGGSSVSATNLTGTLQTASQPNITSVGTLAGLTMSGTLIMSGAISGATTISATTVTATTLNGTIGTAAQGNITSLGTLSSLTMGGTILKGGNALTGSRHSSDIYPILSGSPGSGITIYEQASAPGSPNDGDLWVQA
jgi:hypothetical protein